MGRLETTLSSPPFTLFHPVLQNDKMYSLIEIMVLGTHLLNVFVADFLTIRNGQRIIVNNACAPNPLAD